MFSLDEQKTFLVAFQATLDLAEMGMEGMVEAMLVAAMMVGAEIE